MKTAGLMRQQMSFKEYMNCGFGRVFLFRAYLLSASSIFYVLVFNLLEWNRFYIESWHNLIASVLEQCNVICKELVRLGRGLYLLS